VFGAYRDGRLRLTVRVVVTFVIVAVVHTLWDFLPAVFNLALPYLGAIALTYLLYIVFGVSGALVWRSVSRRANIAASLTSPAVALS
jgi:hypothetical protein